MKISELEKIKKKTIESANLDPGRGHGVRVAVGMATCGIAAGAKPVYDAFREEVKKRGLDDVVVSQTGCIGACRLEPMADVCFPGGKKVTYVKLTAEKAAQIVASHLAEGKECEEYTIGFDD